ncbi:MAG: glycoside hydrolase family 3 protein [Phycicoccus sp.]|nr:glycoside hydrolase family 3 protein [Phycicoccus sp.]
MGTTACSSDSTGTSAAPTSATPSGRATSASATPSASTPSPAPATCVQTLAAGLTPDQQAGQLVMVSLSAGSPGAALGPAVQGAHVGNALYLGGWRSGHADVTATSQILQGLATPDATGGIPLLLAADQEGGAVQQLKGTGFTTIPSALDQATQGPASVTALATQVGSELASAGVNVDLAPVADTVPAELGKANEPIGQWGRQYGFDPASAAAGSDAFVQGLQAAGVAATLKHFPGIGRIQGNTDLTAQGIVDPVMTADDPYLEPFRSGIAQGAQLVMLSSAVYPNLDPDNPAMFSAAIVNGLLRTDLGFTGVAITDDINAVAVQGIPVTDRATRFIAAGGDIVLTGDTSSAGALVAAIRDRVAADTAFANAVAVSTQRVLALKQELGLICQ